MKKNLVFLAFFVAMLGASYLTAQAHEKRPEMYGDCYMTYDCAGSPMLGQFNEDQCRGINGHSLKWGGFCENL